jgi:hypothetical protein
VGKKSNESGQAVIEYVMLLSIILSMAGLLSYGVTKTRDGLWKMIICQVSAPCPACAATQSAKSLLPNGGNCPH